jgi:hypothetical protein
MINTVEKIYSVGEFVNYKMILTNGTTWFVPLDPANTDYQAIQKWIEDGGVVIDNGGN